MPPVYHLTADETTTKFNRLEEHNSIDGISYKYEDIDITTSQYSEPVIEPTSDVMQSSLKHTLVNLLMTLLDSLEIKKEIRIKNEELILLKDMLRKISKHIYIFLRENLEIITDIIRKMLSLNSTKPLDVEKNSGILSSKENNHSQTYKSMKISSVKDILTILNFLYQEKGGLLNKKIDSLEKLFDDNENLSISNENVWSIINTWTSEIKVTNLNDSEEAEIDRKSSLKTIDLLQNIKAYSSANADVKEMQKLNRFLEGIDNFTVAEVEQSLDFLAVNLSNDKHAAKETMSAELHHLTTESTPTEYNLLENHKETIIKPSSNVTHSLRTTLVNVLVTMLSSLANTQNIRIMNEEMVLVNGLLRKIKESESEFLWKNLVLITDIIRTILSIDHLDVEKDNFKQNSKPMKRLFSIMKLVDQEKGYKTKEEIQKLEELFDNSNVSILHDNIWSIINKLTTKMNTTDYDDIDEAVNESRIKPIITEMITETYVDELSQTTTYMQQGTSEMSLITDADSAESSVSLTNPRTSNMYYDPYEDWYRTKKGHINTDLNTVKPVVGSSNLSWITNMLYDTTIRPTEFRDTTLPAFEWSEWQKWQPCSVTCGSGVEVVIRECKLHVDLIYIKSDVCEGNATKTVNCIMSPCSTETLLPITTETNEVLTRTRITPTPVKINKTILKTDEIVTHGDNAPKIMVTYEDWYRTQKKEHKNTDWNTIKPAIGPTNPSGVTNILYDTIRPKEFPDSTSSAYEWSEWGNWQSCSVTCGNGIKVSARECKLYIELLYIKSDLCKGNPTKTVNCMMSPCDNAAENLQNNTDTLPTANNETRDWFLKHHLSNFKHIRREHRVLETVMILVIIFIVCLIVFVSFRIRSLMRTSSDMELSRIIKFSGKSKTLIKNHAKWLKEFGDSIKCKKSSDNKDKTKEINIEKFLKELEDVESECSE
ncbi:uncharacterized protein LOC117100503 [Anneissia japonica]|uniref:uncharacterized protein LOC117100503 n=1 Tax=Anneissia japonica TaxID=1529436 RepID=UPI00142581E5|nr:uncharacterized protein LOC117100503 [Anneissia japonica]